MSSSRPDSSAEMGPDLVGRPLSEFRLAEYELLRRTRPELFANPAGAAYEIVFDPELQDRAARESADRLRAVGRPGHYADLGVVYEDDFMLLVRDAIWFRSGRLGTYTRLLVAGDKVTGGSAVLARYADRIVLVRCFRHASRNWHWEIPRGFGAAGESREQTARRELEEEIGVRVLDIEPLGPLRMEFGMVGDPPQLFWAEVSEPSFLEQEEGLDDVLLATSADLDRLMTQGLLDDAYTLAAIAYARVRGLLTPPAPVSADRST
jgi:ADP-ribose pyrophosphatase